MLTFLNNGKLGVKRQAAFGLVMPLVVAAIVGTFVMNVKVEQLATSQTTTIVPARSAANRLLSFAAMADDNGAQRLAKYRPDVASYQAKLAEATQRADNDTQRALVAEIHPAVIAR